MIDAVGSALRVLGHFWLEEIKADDSDLISALPELAQTVPGLDADRLDALAVEYQRLFGFNLPPYESLFIDPSAMLMAPATSRVQTLYRQAGWQPPGNRRSGAPDHLGLELLALADWLTAGQNVLAHRLHVDHLALWVPSFVLALWHLNPHPFYHALGDLTLELILATLPVVTLSSPAALFPDLPPPPVYRGSDAPPFESPVDPEEIDEVQRSLRQVVKRFLPAREVGMFLTREEIARISQSLDLPITMGERFRMLESLFRQAGQYELVPALLDELSRGLADTDAAYQQLATEYPNWRPYATAWQHRLAETQAMCASLKSITGTDYAN